MRKKSEFTIVERAIQTVEGFSRVFKTLQQQTTLRGQSQSTLNNYIRRIALICLEFNRLPEEISQDEINEYLTRLAQSPASPSRSSFKHAVYGLRYYFRHIGQNKRSIALPPIKGDTRFPVILNRDELRRLFLAPQLLKHRIVLTLIYSAGLRSQEVIDVSLHSLRHSYATHLLEEGVNIVTIKELLGHAEIATTMIYLHVAQCPVTVAHSPLDTLYAKR